jgi:hypothetical protein
MVAKWLQETKSENKRAEQICLETRVEEWGGGEVVRIIYTHVSKCKNNKIKTTTT